MTNRGMLRLLLTAIVAATAIALIVASTTDLIPVTANQGVLGVLTGIFLMWLIDITSKGVSPSPVIAQQLVINFDREMWDTEFGIAERETVGRSGVVRRLDDSSRSLLSSDPVLALAMTRIHLERALRYLAEVAAIPVESSRSSIRGLLEALVTHEVLPTALLEPVNEVVAVCNKAVHGYAVDRTVAEEIVDSGERLVGLINELAERRLKHAG